MVQILVHVSVVPMRLQRQRLRAPYDTFPSARGFVDVTLTYANHFLMRTLHGIDYK